MKKNLLFLSFLVFKGGLMAQTNLAVKSEAFKNGEPIPSYYTCDNKELKNQPSPQLEWSKGPQGSKSYAIVVHDPDAPMAGGFYHWVVFNLSAETTYLPEKVVIKSPAVESVNSSGKTIFMGPCPPKGQHRYYFRVYALSDMLKLDSSAKPEQVMEEISKYKLAQGELMGVYQRVSK